MSDNPFRDRLRWMEAKEKMNAAENAFSEFMVTGHNFGMPLEDVVKRLCSMTLRLLKRAMKIANERDKRKAQCS